MTALARQPRLLQRLGSRLFASGGSSTSDLELRDFRSSGAVLRVKGRALLSEGTWCNTLHDCGRTAEDHRGRPRCPRLCNSCTAAMRRVLKRPVRVQSRWPGTGR